MASRYGRNKKRAHLAEIAALRSRIEELLGPWERAREGDFEIDPRYVIYSRELKTDERNHMREYEVELRVQPYPALDTLIFQKDHWNAFVNWNGLNWKMEAILERMSNRDWDDYGAESFPSREWLTLKLTNVRRPPYR